LVGEDADWWERMLTAVRNRTQILAHLREPMIFLVAVIKRASFEFEPLHLMPGKLGWRTRRSRL